MKGDRAVDAGAGKLDALAGRAAAKGGLGEKLAEELAGDAAFLRRLKPSLVTGRVRGERPTEPARVAVAPAPATGPAPAKARAGPNPFAVTGAAFAVGAVLAKVIDWRGHAHPRR